MIFLLLRDRRLELSDPARIRFETPEGPLVFACHCISPNRANAFDGTMAV